MDIPTNLIVFGVTGDLASRKIFPALYELLREGKLPQPFRLIGFARRDIGDGGLREIVARAIRTQDDPVDEALLETLLTQTFYVRGDFARGRHYEELNARLATLDKAAGVHCSNRLLYLATTPDLYENLFTELAHSGLASACQGDGSWVRIAVEKPFGRDLATAERLDQLLGKLFPEEAIFRIDHYLGKRTLQNILTFRFANAIFAPLWHKGAIESVHCRLFETLGTEGRGDFYDGVGALRDIGQNHLLQMLAAIAMREPSSLVATDIRAAREQVLESLRPLRPDEWGHQIKRGQYRGYRDEEGVAADSTTETYFRITTELSDETWSGVPFTLEGGKRMRENDASITVVFRERATPFGEWGHTLPNILTFRMQPQPKISVSFVVRGESLDRTLTSRELAFDFSADEEDLKTMHRHEAYEHVLHHALIGDQTNFTSTREVRAAWAFVTPILEAMNTLPLTIYEPGTNSETFKK